MVDFRAIAKSHLPRGFTLVESNTKSSYAKKAKKHWSRKYKLNTVALLAYDRRRIFIPKLDNAGSLFYFFHEVGHYRLGHCSKRKLDHHREEYEADQFARGMMRVCGVPTPRWVVKGGKDYIKACILADEKVGIPIFAPARKYGFT